jgi:hypothetical protein
LDSSVGSGLCAGGWAEVHSAWAGGECVGGRLALLEGRPDMVEKEKRRARLEGCGSEKGDAKTKTARVWKETVRRDARTHGGMRASTGVMPP